MTITYTDVEIEALRVAIVSAATTGVLSVEYDGPPKRKVTFRSISEMQATLSKMVATSATSARTTTYRLVKTSKGF